jgi:nitrite reductase (NADH) large subunit
MSQTIIVIGLSAASMAFITKLRTFDQNSEIIAFSAEKDFPYNRCFLADFLTGESSLRDIQLKPEDFFQKNNIEVYFNTKVTKIDAQNQRVFTDETSYPYDYLFLGIGTRPFIPNSLQAFDGQGVFTFHTLSDMEKISKFIEINNPKSAVVIGAGLNGIEAASGLSSKGIPVAVIEAQSSILPGQVDQETADWLEDIIRKKGLMIIKSHKVVNLCGKDDFITAVELDSGTKIASELVIIAAGSKLNSELLENTGIELSNGSIVVNQNMQTNISNILASGDICVVPDMISKLLTRSTTWSDAMLQGLCAATTLSSTPRLYPGMIGMRDSYFFDKDFYACGQTAETTSLVKTICKQTDQDLEVVFTAQGILKGFILIGDISKLSEYKKKYLIQVN